MPSQVASIWSLGPSAFLPTLLYGIGQGAILPAVALSALSLGASPTLAGLVVACGGLGQMAGDIPAGLLAARIGERRAMIAASGFAVLALVGCIVATAIWALALAIFATGMATAVWNLARQVYLTDAVPLHLRARALSTLGGSMRVGQFIGPFVGALAIGPLGPHGAYWVHLGAALLAVVVLLVVRDLGAGPHASPRVHGVPRPTTLGVMRDNRTALATLGVGSLLIGAVRASRQVVVPLWAAHVGLDAVTISIIFGLSGLMETLFFYPAGLVMDRFGRRWIAVPSMVVLALAHCALPFTTDVVSLTIVALCMGIGNGMGSGLVMTLAADASPAIGRSQFLGVFRLFQDTGNGLGPMLISLVTAIGTLTLGIFFMAVVGLGGAAWLASFIPPRARPSASSEPAAEPPL